MLFSVLSLLFVVHALLLFLVCLVLQINYCQRSCFPVFMAAVKVSPSSLKWAVSMPWCSQCRSVCFDHSGRVVFLSASSGNIYLCYFTN